jgi:hypothetical protein
LESVPSVMTATKNRTARRIASWPGRTTQWMDFEGVIFEEFLAHFVP